MPRRRRPPRKVCVGCSQMFYGYGVACRECMDDQEGLRHAVSDTVRDSRKTTPADRPEQPKPLRYGEFPDGY